MALLDIAQKIGGIFKTDDSSHRKANLIKTRRALGH